MNCSQFRHEISSYLDFELSYHELKTFKEHLQSCSLCAELATAMEKNKVLMGEELQATLPSDFVLRLQERLRAELHRTPAWWREIMTPRIMGFSPVSLGGLAAAVLALMVIGISLFQSETVPLIDPPSGAQFSNPNSPSMMVPSSTGPAPSAGSVLTATSSDSIIYRQDSTQRDFTGKMRYVNQVDNP